jgi:hypothetical protein
MVSSTVSAGRREVPRISVTSIFGKPPESSKVNVSVPIYVVVIPPIYVPSNSSVIGFKTLLIR